MRLIDADELKRALKSNCTPELCHDINTAWCDSCCRTNDFEDLIDNAPTVKERPQGKWFDCIEAGTLKARHGDYVLYKVDFLLDHLAREVYIMEGTRRMKGGAE
jgi:hypothetical protein